MQYWPQTIGNIFEPGGIHIGRVRFHNPSSVGFTYASELYLGRYEGEKVVSVSSSFTIPAGETKDIDFSLDMPLVEDIYRVYLDVSAEGELVAHYQSYDDIEIKVTAAIDIISIIWI